MFGAYTSRAYSGQRRSRRTRLRVSVLGTGSLSVVTTAEAGCTEVTIGRDQLSLERPAGSPANGHCARKLAFYALTLALMVRRQLSDPAGDAGRPACLHAGSLGPQLHSRSGRARRGCFVLWPRPTPCHAVHEASVGDCPRRSWLVDRVQHAFSSRPRVSTPPRSGRRLPRASTSWRSYPWAASAATRTSTSNPSTAARRPAPSSSPTATATTTISSIPCRPSSEARWTRLPGGRRSTRCS